MQTLKTRITFKTLTKLAQKYNLEPYRERVPQLGYRYFFNGSQARVKNLIADLKSLNYNVGGNAYHGIEINKDVYNFTYI